MIKKQKYSFDFVTGVCLPEIDLIIESVDVVGGVRPLQVTWTPELAQDLEAYHNIDAEQELTNLLSQQVAAEIDREIIRDLRGMIPEPDPIQPNRGRLLTIGQVGERQRMGEIRQRTLDKWSRLGFLEGLEGHVRENIALLYEGQASTLINETTPPGPSPFDTLQFPTVRRVHAHLVAEDIVGFEPTPNLVEEQEEYEIEWRTGTTWVYENLYGSLIGITMELKPHEFIPKYKSAFDIVNLPTVNRVFS